MIHTFRPVHTDQQGITFVEILVAIGVAGIIAGAIVTTIFQVVIMNTTASDHMIVARQVQQAGKDVSRDIYQAQTIVLAEGEAQDPPGTGFPLTLTWRDLELRDNVVVYRINARNELEREHSRYDGDDLLSTKTTIIARHIDIRPEKTHLDKTLSDDLKTVLVFTVTATKGEQSETRVYEVQPRPHQKEPSG